MTPNCRRRAPLTHRAAPVVALSVVLLVSAACGAGSSEEGESKDRPPGSAGDAVRDEGSAGAITTSSPADEPPANPYLVDSPWPQGHRNPAAQASTPISGPVDPDVQVDLVDWLADSGQERVYNGAPIPQTSPWMALSSERYADAPGARSLWAVTLTDVYKYSLDGDDVRYVDHQQLRGDYFSVMWNFFILAGDRVVVPAPLGTEMAGEACDTRAPALLELRDGDMLDSPIRCVGRFEFSPDVVARCQGPDGAPIDPANLRYSAVFTAVTYTGDVVVNLNVANPAGGEHVYLAVVDHGLQRLRTCRYLDDSPISNQFAVEPLDGARSAIYAATGEAIVKVVFDGDSGELERRWERAVPLRFRTGTTPTLLGFGDDRLVVVVDAPCAVSNVFTGAIACDEGTAPARVIALRRDDDRDERYEVALPSSFRTVENSPSAWDDRLVVAAYSGYRPDPSVRGVAAVAWDASLQQLRLAWASDEVQMNGVTTISGGSNLVYSSGVDASGAVHLYGLRLRDDGRGVGGEVLLDVRVGGPDDAVRTFDAGNNTVIDDDGSLMWSTSAGFVRVRPR